MQSIGKEWVFVWGLETPNQRVELLSLAKDPIKETKVTVGYLESARLIDCAIEGKLHTLDEVKCDGIF